MVVSNSSVTLSPEIRFALAEIHEESNVLFLFVCSLFVFMMQAGFAFLEAGSVRSTNTRNILTKNILEPICGGLLFWLIGYGVAYGGDDDNGFAGNIMSGGDKSFAFRVDDHSDSFEGEYDKLVAARNGYAWAGYFFQFCFAAAATTIVSGSVAGRCSIPAYFVYSSVIITCIYPVIVHWLWDSEGWLCAWGTNNKWGGAIDFAGSGVVHMTGGCCALVAAVLLGPRKNRFTEPSKFAAHSAPLQVLGTMLLWVGWYGFNCGSTLGIHGYGSEVGRIAVTTSLSACSGGLIAMIFGYAITGKYDLGVICNGILGGLVGVTAACSVIEPYAAIIIGLISGSITVGVHHGVIAMGIDDPLDAFAVHGACGCWGVIAVGIFATDYYTYNGESYEGLLYGDSGGELLGIQLLFVLCIVCWTMPMMTITLLPLKALGIYRLPDHIQEQGIDMHEHEGAAYVIVPVIPSFEEIGKVKMPRVISDSQLAPTPTKAIEKLQPPSLTKLPRVGSDVQLAPITTRKVTNIPPAPSMDNVAEAR